MATVVSPPEQRVLLENITWELYERLLEAHRDCSVPRFTYDRGRLEIMSPSAEHEQIKETVSLLINIVAEEMGINAEGFGSPPEIPIPSRSSPWETWHFAEPQHSRNQHIACEPLEAGASRRNYLARASHSQVEG